MKILATLSFIDGLLTVKISGYDDSNGNGTISFSEQDLEWGEGDDYNKRYMNLERSELEAIRDFLIEWLK